MNEHEYDGIGPETDEPCGCDMRCNHHHDTDRAFFVTIQDAGRTGWLLGPYPTHYDALQEVGRGKELAVEARQDMWFASFGTASVPESEASRIKPVFRKEG